MSDKHARIYPYIPNSVPAVKAEMLREVGAESIEELFEEIPEELRLKELMDLPEPFLSEQTLRRHVEGILSRNVTAREFISFLGAGCSQHHVPAVCDEVNSRSEFLTAYAGEPYDDHGRFQVMFEYASMMGELLNMEVVSVPTYDGLQAAATAICMAARITGRRQVLVAGAVNPEKLSKITDYCTPSVDISVTGFETGTGEINLDDLKSRLSSETAAIFIENPTYLGKIEPAGPQIADMAHQNDSLLITSVDPISLGVLSPPADYGADIVCGDIQPLGMHMQFGGGQAGFIATRDEEKFIMEYPSRLFGIAPTRVKGEYGFGDVA